jgi:co-chaperonin GroES (HSP10)
MSGYVGYALRAGKSKTGQKIISKVKDFFKSRGSKVPSTIKSVETNVPKTKIQKATRNLKIATGKLEGSKAKLKQTQFEIKNNMPLTFKKKSGRSIKESDRKKKIIKDNNKVIGRMFRKALKGDK